MYQATAKNKSTRNFEIVTVTAYFQRQEIAAIGKYRLSLIEILLEIIM